ncbi:MAG: lipocalin-like domain-containing protein [Chloroflexi bacterium]|nr:lipocalin-like domain-containing protein [Chloroflexota bacterium]
MVQNPFVGTWRLVSFELRSADGQVSYPYGQDAAGYIMYNEDGYMSVAFMSANRPKFVSGNIRGGSTEEKVAAVDTDVSYCGTYEIQGDKVIHHIEVSLFPNWIGVDKERIFAFDGDRLSLSTPPLLVDGIQQTGHLVWQRV